MSENEQQAVAENTAENAAENAPESAANPAEQAADSAQQTATAEPAATGTQVQQADLPEAQDARQGSGGGQIDILLDSPMSVSVCLGSARPAVRELLEMGPGSVLRLDRQVGEPIDLYLRGIRFATGHLVVVDDRLGVRIKEILATGTDSQNAAGG